MPETQTVDEVVSVRTNTRGAGGGLSARPVEQESASASTGTVKTDRSGMEDDAHSVGGRHGRPLKESTAKLLEQFEKEEKDARSAAPHDEGDADEDETPEDGGGSSDADEGGGDADVAGDAAEGEEAGEGDGEEEGEADEADPTAEWQAKYATLEQRNVALIDELDTARKTPKTQRTERETALIAAEAAYVEEGSIPAIRKFLAIVVGAAPDSKDVDAELTGVLTDLTARELGVTLDQNQQTLRDNARTRLILARDKREKVEAEKKPAVDNSADGVQYEQAARHVDNLLGTKGQSGTSLADEYPMLMELAENFDGLKPADVLARAIRREIMTGTLDPKTSDIDMVRAVAPKIENYYDAVAKRIEAARAKKIKPGTTTPSVKPKAAVETSTEQRQSTGARTLTNAAASRAPAKPPKKMTKQKTSTAEKQRKDFKTDAEWRSHLLNKHFEA